PLGAYLAYWLLDRRLPARYRYWVRADIGGALFSLRRVLMLWTLMVLTLLGVNRALLALDPVGSRDSLPEQLHIWMAVWFVMGTVSLVSGRLWRDKAARRFLVLRAGDPVVEGDFVEGLGPKRRLDARGWLTAALVVVSIAAAAW